MKFMRFALFFYVPASLIAIIVMACAHPESDDQSRARAYYRGVWDTCVWEARRENQSEPGTLCLNGLNFALNEDWYNGTGWIAMPYLEPLNSNTPVFYQQPGG